MASINFFTLNELYSVDGLKKIDNKFLSVLKEKNLKLYEKLKTLRKTNSTYNPKNDFSFFKDLNPIFEDFISEIFPIKSQLKQHKSKANNFKFIYICKRNFIQKRIINKLDDYSHNDSEIDDFIKKNGLNHSYNLEKLFKKIGKQLSSNKLNDKFIKTCENFFKWVLINKNEYFDHNHDLFHFPQKNQDVDKKIIRDQNNSNTLKYLKIKNRYDFSLNSNEVSNNHLLNNTNYCLFCHDRDKDSCSKGFLKNNLKGCPLDQKISEFQYFANEGSILSALAIICIDNPMVAATGNRICNDCSKSCIFQNQEPVDIPSVESKTLVNVLDLTFGFEIYSLLTKWNPFKFNNYLPRPFTGKKILISGLGPSGFTSAHYLLQAGHLVVAIDGLKIEKIENKIIGDALIDSVDFRPIKNTRFLYEDLDTRVPIGFGGVAEYGITVRWNKNFLKIIQIILQRHKNFLLLDGVKLESNLTIKDAINEEKFDHICLAHGAGKPNIPSIDNNLIKGVKTASDFLMNLQLSGAYNLNSLSNLFIRMPIAVIGGGLTAIDTATESKQYYFRMLEIVGMKLDKLKKNNKLDSYINSLSAEEKSIYKEICTHFNELKNEIRVSKINNRNPNYNQLLKNWGGVKIIYRKDVKESPSYNLNKEELHKALEEGIEFIDNTDLKSINKDEYQTIKSVLIHHKKDDKNREIPLRTLLFAIGTRPNTSIVRDTNLFNLNNDGFLSTIKHDNSFFIANYNGVMVSQIGDMHPQYSGSVVKAMAGAKHLCQLLNKVLDNSKPKSINRKTFFLSLKEKYLSTVHKINKLNEKVYEIIIKSPKASHMFKPGQFFKLQNYHSKNKKPFEPLALTGASVNKQKGLISTVVLEMGGSSNFCKSLKKDEQVVFMGPTGMPTHIHKNKKVLLMGGGLGNAVLFSIGQELIKNNSNVLYFAGYKQHTDVFLRKYIENASNTVVWCSDDNTKIKKTRDYDLSFTGNILDCLKKYHHLSLTSEKYLKLNEIEGIILIGSDSMMSAVSGFINSNKNIFSNSNHCIASINSPMQCMMKEICGQCLQEHFDPKTKIKSIIFSCAEQDQNFKTVNFDVLKNRLRQNSFLEKLDQLYLDF